MLLGEGGTLTTEAYMGTVAIELETRRSGVETDLSRFLWKGIRTTGVVRRQARARVSEYLTSTLYLCRAAGEVVPR